MLLLDYVSNNIQSVDLSGAVNCKQIKEVNLVAALSHVVGYSYSVTN